MFAVAPPMSLTTPVSRQFFSPSISRSTEASLRDTRPSPGARDAAEAAAGRAAAHDGHAEADLLPAGIFASPYIDAGAVKGSCTPHRSAR